MPDVDDLTFTDEIGYLRVTVSVTGVPELGRALRAIERIASEVARRHAERVLIDARAIPGRRSTLDKFRLGEAAAARLRFKCALISSLEDADHFTETVARNRGANGLVFTDEREALAWLLAE